MTGYMMSQSAKPILLGITVLAALLLIASYTLRRDPDVKAPADTAEQIRENEPVDTRSPRLSTNLAKHFQRNGKSHSAATEVTSGVRTVALQTPAALPPLTGYALDHFDDWTTIPLGYHADGVITRNGALTLAGNPDSTGSRTGIIMSPPLPLRSPALAAPVQPSVATPEGANVILEISLSEDGQSWSPWAMLQRYQAPDGHRVAPPLQAALSTAQIAARNEKSSRSISPLPGPAVRYRLTLSASGAKAPSVSDVRIWKREYQTQ
jgi:hypothetical protein